MINLLINHLKSHSLYKEKELCSLLDRPDCAASIKTKVLAFDAIKDKFSEDIGKRNDRLTSADLFIMIPSNNELCFIEMKSFDNTKSLTCIEFAKLYLQDEIPRKMVDSILLLLGIAGFYGIHRDFYSRFFNPSKFKITAFFFSDFTPQEISLIITACGKELSIGLTRRITGSIGIMNCNDFVQKFGDS